VCGGGVGWVVVVEVVVVVEGGGVQDNCALFNLHTTTLHSFYAG
jgi:hypothetical protein